MTPHLKHKVEKVIELKSSAQQSFNLWKKQAFQIPKYAPSSIQAILLQHGAWGTSGSVFLFKYTLAEGKSEVLKGEMGFKEEKLKISITGLAGDVMKLYKFYKFSVVFEPKLDGCLAIITIRYEKLNHSIPAPHNYMDLSVTVLQQIDAHI